MLFVKGKNLLGWGVVREMPWHFVGIFESQLQAAAKAIDLGPGYAAHYGESTNAQTFVWGLGVEAEVRPKAL